MNLLKGKRALIIGASGGLGMACVREFLAEGAEVVGTYRRESENLQSLAQEHAQINLLPLDIADAQAIQEQVRKAAEILGGLDILVYAVGISRPALLHGVKAEDWEEVLQSNLTAVFHAMQAAVRPLMRSGGGAVVNISSVFGERGGPGQSSYCASKAGVMGLTRAAAVELAPKRIRFNVVAPGFIETAMTADFGEKQRQQAEDHIPMKRFGKPEDVAALCAFLASDKAAYITGQVMNIDGGLTAR
ncbi:MAG: SDR family oxidoreductase [Selenomonas sp.]|nr:SDR family oxidoreductase [Selenomonas sp.]